MTIDEAIAQYREKAEYFKSTTNVAYALELEQIAEWLEELKDYRDKNKMVVRIDCINSEEFNDLAVKLAKEQYNNAIDDFSEKISLEISESIIWGMLFNSHKDNSFDDTSDKIVDYIIETSKDIAEQLRSVNQNEQSI